jgi:hypothetical protein
MPQPIAPLQIQPRRAPQSQQRRVPFDLAFGDSIAVQQYNHGVAGTADDQFTRADQPLKPGRTGGVGDPPSRVLARLQQTLQSNPSYFKGKRLFLSPGTSNNPAQLADVKQIFDTIKGLGDNAPASVVVPGVGPGVRGNAQGAVNAQLAPLVQDAGFKYYQPAGLRWAGDGVHPANGADMQAGAGGVAEAPAAAPTTPPATTTPPAMAPEAVPRRYGNVVPYDASRLTAAVGATQQQYDLWRSYLAQRESAGYGQLPNGDRHSPIALEGQTQRGYMGRYQMGSQEIIKSAQELGIPTPSQPELLSNPNLQEQLFEQYTIDHHDRLMSNPQYADGDGRTRLSLLMGAHLGGVGGVERYLSTGQGPSDERGTSVGNYVSSAYHVLGGEGAPTFAAAPPPAAPLAPIPAPAPVSQTAAPAPAPGETAMPPPIETPWGPSEIEPYGIAAPEALINQLYPQGGGAPAAPQPPSYVAAPSGMETGLPPGGQAPPGAPPVQPSYIPTPAGSGMQSGIPPAPSSNFNPSQPWWEPQGTASYQPSPTSPLTTGGAVPRAVAQQKVQDTGAGGPASLPYPGTQGQPDPGPTSNVGGPGGKSDTWQPPTDMTGRQMMQLLAGAYRGVPVSYDPGQIERIGVVRNPQVPANALSQSHLGLAPPGREFAPAIATPRIPSMGIVQSPFFNLVGMGARRSQGPVGTEIGAEIASSPGG